MKLLFVSNLFPDAVEPYRGLDNATLLHHLADRWSIRVLAVRPSLFPKAHLPRKLDALFHPRFIPVPYIPKVGSRWNHHLMARALHGSITRLRRDFSFDVVLCAWLFPDSCAVAKLAPEMDFPFVAIAQGSDVHQYLRMPVRRRLITRLLTTSSAIITRSAELTRLLGEAGLPKERLHPIYNGVDLDLFQPGRKIALRRELGLPAEAPMILFVGNFYAVKNPRLPALALARLRTPANSAPPVLVMIGGGELQPQVRRLAAHLGLQSRIFLAGRKSAAEVARYMQAAEFLCLPSHNEGVPNVILEAFACGLPVVASRVGGIPEVHPGEGFGRLVTPIEPAAFAQAFEQVLAEPPSAERIRDHALQFSWARTSAACHELLLAALR